MTATEPEVQDEPGTEVEVAQTSAELERHVDFTSGQVELLKRTIATGTSDDEFELFLSVCKRTGLDPFARQIFAIMRKDQGTPKLSIQISIDGFRLIAARTGRYGGQIAPQWCGPDMVWREVWLDETPPAAARVGVLRVGFQQPLYSVATMAEYRQNKSGGGANNMWSRFPATMLAKCLPGKARIETDQGMIPIQDIVKGRLDVQVRSINLETGDEEWRPVVNWWTNLPTREWVTLQMANGERWARPVRVTHDHPIWTPTGWVKAGELVEGEEIAVTSPTLSHHQEQVVLGGLLGDAHLAGRKRTTTQPHFAVSHSVAQVDYLQWTARNLANLQPTVTEVNQDDGTGKRHPTVRLRTRTAAALYQYRYMTPSERLDRLDPLGLAVWFMDDGSFRPTGGRPDSIGAAIHCCGFGVEFADHAVDWLWDRFGIEARVLRRERNPYLSIGMNGASILRQIISPYVIADGARKVWVADDIEQGANHGYAFVPLTRVEHVVRGDAETRYDIEVEGTHTFIHNGLVLSNCAESQALRKAFPAELSGLYTEDEMAQAGGQPMTVTTSTLGYWEQLVAEIRGDEVLREEIDIDDVIARMLAKASEKAGVEITDIALLPEAQVAAAWHKLKKERDEIRQIIADATPNDIHDAEVVDEPDAPAEAEVAEATSAPDPDAALDAAFAPEA